jgi:uncharacterized protein YndB with AHSA1/START domain
MRVEESVQINRPPREVFDYVANPENLPEWAGSSLEIQKDAPGPLGQGDRFMSVSKFLGKHIEMPFEITAYETGRLYSHRSTGGPFATEWTLSFEERAVGGTRLTQVAEGEPGGFFKLAEPLLERLIRRQFRTDLENLKDLLEARG